MTRILHTADWQLGLRVSAAKGELGPRLRDERFRAVERIAAVARARAVEAVVVAGDVFDDNQVGPATLQRARDVLASFAPIPVLLLPGNHDAAEPGGALARLRDGRPELPHVHVLLDHEPRDLGALVVYPCPLATRHVPDDPTAHLPPRDPDDRRVRVAVAHGGVLDFGAAEVPNLIDADAVLARGFDWLALGDWHGRYEVGPRAAYPGTPEPTRFKERDPGHVLLVEIDEAGALPRVEAVNVAGTTWIEPDAVDVHTAADVDRLAAWLAAIDRPSATLVRLSVRGALRPDDRLALDRTLDAHAETLLRLDLDLAGLRTQFTADDLATLDAPGFLGDALATLAASSDPADHEAAALVRALLAEVRP